MICTSNRSKDFRSRLQHFHFQLTQYFRRKWSAPASNDTKIISSIASWLFEYLCMHLMFILFLEPPSSCSIFKLHPGTFSFSIISDIFQAIFINSNSYQINWENAQIHVPKSRTKFIFFPPVERQTWSPRSFYHHLNGFSSIPSDGEQGSIRHLLYFNVLLFQFELNSISSSRFNLVSLDSNNTRVNLF